MNRLAVGQRVPVRIVAGPAVAGLVRTLTLLGVASVERRVPAAVHVGGVREALGLTQLEFATRFDLDAVQNWEQGRTRPDRNARILLRVIETQPEVVEEALA